jgi:hypothetical protein
LARPTDPPDHDRSARSRPENPDQLSKLHRIYLFGLRLGEIVEDIGGGTQSGRQARAVQVGGPLGAYFPRALFDTPFDYEAFASRDGLIGHGGVVMFDDTVDMARQARFALEFCALESCGKCTPCHIGSVRGTGTMDKIIRGERVEANLALITDLCQMLRFGSLCALGGFTPYPVMSAIRHFPDDFDRPRFQAAADWEQAISSCRLCLVEIEGRAGTPASCTTPVAAGMVMSTQTERLKQIRKGVMELYISDHPLDCLTCVRQAVEHLRRK